MTWKPKLSVGMPVYNAAHYLPSAIGCILEQSFSDLELVISDNASIDSSFEVCEEFARSDSRIRLFRNERNLGIAENFNRVFRFSRAPYFFWASSNDWFAPQFAERCIDALEYSPHACLCSTQTRFFSSTVEDAVDYADDMAIQSDSPVDRFWTLQQRLRVNNVMHGVIRRDALVSTRLIGSYYSADCVLATELALRGKFIQIAEPLYFRRMTADAATNHMSAAALSSYWAPENEAMPSMQAWRMNIDLWRMLICVPLSTVERLRFMHRVAKLTYWNRAALVKDISEWIWRPTTTNY